MGKAMSFASTAPARITDNGLLALLGELCGSPEEGRLVVALVDVSSIKHDIDTGDTVPTVRIVSVEPILDDAAAARVRDIMDAAMQRRTGRAMLPLDLQNGAGVHVGGGS